jgi:hypothetical protein
MLNTAVSRSVPLERAQVGAVRRLVGLGRA